MRGLDDKDEAILAELLEDSRKPYSAIAEMVGLSPPAVSDRADRLVEMGLIERFTLDLNRELLREGQSVLLTITGTPGSGEDIATALRQAEAVEHVFRTVEDTVLCTLVAPLGDLDDTLSELIPLEDVEEYDVQVLADSSWSPALDGVTLAPECVECGNTVTQEGERERFDGTLYHFCCSSCLESFSEQYEQLQEDA